MLGGLFLSVFVSVCVRACVRSITAVNYLCVHRTCRVEDSLGVGSPFVLSVSPSIEPRSSGWEATMSGMQLYL